MACEGKDGRGTSNNDLGMPHIEDNTLALCFKPCAGDPSFLEAFLTPRSLEPTGDDAACITPAARDLIYFNPDFKGAEYSPCRSIIYRVLTEPIRVSICRSIRAYSPTTNDTPLLCGRCIIFHDCTHTIAQEPRDVPVRIPCCCAHDLGRL